MDRVQQSSAEQTVETPDITLGEKIVAGPVTQTQQVVNTSVQQVVDTAEVEKHIIHEKINQVTRHVEIPLLQIVKKTVEVPEVPPLQFTDKVDDIPVVAPRQISQLQVDDKVVDVPVVLVVQAPLVQVMAETAEIPQLQVVEKIGEIPEWLNFARENFPVCIPRETLQQNKILRVVKKTLVKSRLEMLAEIECDEGREFMLQGNDSVSVAKDVEYEATEVSEKSPDCMVCSSASGSTRQQHKQRATTQTAQEEERGSEGRGVREGDKKMGGQVEQEQGKEEREKGRKGQR